MIDQVSSHSYLVSSGKGETCTTSKKRKRKQQKKKEMEIEANNTKEQKRKRRIESLGPWGEKTKRKQRKTEYREGYTGWLKRSAWGEGR
jgi:hypothetical protein